MVKRVRRASRARVLAVEVKRAGVAHANAAHAQVGYVGRGEHFSQTECRIRRIAKALPPQCGGGQQAQTDRK